MAQTATAFHAYVDSIYGDDAEATRLNPSPLGPAPAGRPMQQHPIIGNPPPPPPPPPFPGFLQHAPYSFRTVTGCLAWFSNNWPATQGRHLPWTNPDTLKTVEYLIIHCMPGLYGPSFAPAIDADSGLPWNGESFPLKLPQRVSIQGTSALDTIFDARRTSTSVFSIRHQSPEDHHAFEHTFIDGITIRGARGSGEGGPGQRPGAGVLIDDEHPVSATISNCFITDNVVGIAVIADVDDFFHEPIIVNNTIAWNQVGLYNWSVVTGKGENKLRVLNNVLDSSVPFGLHPMQVVGVSCFEGVDVADRTCSKGTGMIDFNAYEVITDPTLTRTNIGDVRSNVPYSWPRTQTRTPPQTSYQPRVRIEDYTKPPPDPTYSLYSAERQVLYINDVFRKDPALPQICNHDFRLSPTARRKTGDFEIAGFNPLINQGVDFGLSGGKPVYTGLLAFQTGLTITYAPGLLPPGLGNAEPLAALNCWDYDADGFGNQRVAGRNHAPVLPEGLVDLGADESHELTISGFVESTRTFSRAHAAVAPNSAGIGTRDAVYLFNVVSIAYGNTYFRPQFNFNPDLVYSSPHGRQPGSQWYNQAAANPYDGGVTNYTSGKFDDRDPLSFAKNRRWHLTTFAVPQPLFMRNLACDIAPHLLHDIGRDLTNLNAWYQWWGEQLLYVTPPAYTPYTPYYEDVFKSNPWYNSTNAFTHLWDNRWLYFEPSDPSRWNQAGHINPCLVVLDAHMPPTTPPTRRMLFFNNLHPILLWEWGPITFTYTINGYGRIISGPLLTGADPVPFVSAWHGLRINCELLDPDNPNWPTWPPTGVPLNNVQTFLVVQGPGAGVPEIGSDGSVPPEQQVQSLTADTERRQLMRAKLEELRRARR